MLQRYISSKQKNSKLKRYALCLGNISKDFAINDMKKTGLKVVRFVLLILVLLI